jgi:curved DNA-binding protein CbpA
MLQLRIFLHVKNNACFLWQRSFDNRTAMADEELNRILAPNASYYDILGVTSTATVEEVRKAYKKLAVKYHPDKYRGERAADAHTAFLYIADACNTLSDESRRAEYDRTLHQNQQSTSSGTTSNRSDPHPHWSEAEKTAYAFSMFLRQVESDINNGENVDDAGVAVLASMAVLKESASAIASNPIIGTFLLFTGLIYGLVTTPQQRTDHLAAAGTALNWNNWSKESKLQAVQLLQNYYEMQFYHHS